MVRESKERSLQWALILVFCFLSASVILGGINYYRAKLSGAVKNKFAELEAIAKLKTEEIVNWRAERYGDAVVIRENTSLAASINALFRDKNNSKIREDLLRWMNFMTLQYDYRSILLVSGSEKVKLAYPESDSLIGDYLKFMIDSAISSGHIVFSDLHRSATLQDIHMDIIAPFSVHSISDAGLPSAVVLRVNPDRILFPLIESWPVPSKSSETLLIRRQGDSVLYLNNILYNRNAALAFSLSANKMLLPAAKAASDYEGPFEGVDYRGIPVISYLKKIPGSPWYMVAKVDRDEVLNEFKRSSLSVSVVVILLVLFSGSVVTVIWRNQRTRYYKDHLETEIEKNKALEKLRETTEYLDKLVNYTNAPLIVWDNELLITRVNPAFERLSGRKAGDVIGKKIDILFPAETRDESMLIVHGRSVDERWDSVEIPVLHTDGTIKTVLWNSAKLHGEKSNVPLATIAQGHDITGRISAEKALRESDRMYRSLFENMLNGFAYCKMYFDENNEPVDFSYLAVNGAFADLTGLRNVSGRKVSEVIPGLRDNDQELLNMYGRVASGGKPEKFEYFLKSLGMWFNVSVYCTEYGYFVAIFDVITERKNLEKELMEKEERFRRVFEEGQFGIVLVGLDFRFMHVNDAFCKMTGYPREELTGMTFNDITHPENVESDLESVKNIVDGSLQYYRTEKRYIRRDGSLMWGSINVSAMRDQNGQFMYLLAMINDITDRKEFEENIRLHSEMLSHMSEGVYLIRLSDGIIIETNPAFDIMFGYDHGEMIGKHLSIVNAPSDENPADKAARIMAAIEKEGMWKGDIENIKKDGTRFWCHSEVSLFNHSKHGKVLLAVHLDISGQKKTQDELIESEAKFRSLFEYSPLGKSLTLPDGTINVNKAFCDMLGYSAEELKLKNWREITHPDDIEQTEGFLNLLISGKKDEIRFEKRYLHRDGSTVYMDVSTYLHRDIDGSPAYYITTVNDITDRKLLEKERFKLLDIIEKSLNEIYLFDSENLRFEYVNRGALKNIGYSFDEMKMMTPLSIKPEFTEPVFRKMIKPLLAGEKEILVFETTHRRKNGTVYPVEVHLQLYRQEKSSLFFAVISDISERKIAEESLRNSEHRFRTTLDTMLEGCQIISHDWNYLYINEAAEIQNRRPKDEMLGKRYTEMWPGIEHTEMYRKIKECMEERKIHQMENYFEYPDGSHAWLNLRIQPVAEGIFILSMDITERKGVELKILNLNKELEERVLERTSQLEAANRELEAFSYSVSHDLRAPLRAVHSFTGILKEEYGEKLDEEGQRICGIIESGSMRMGQLIDDLLSFSRVGRSELQFSKIDMVSLVKSVFSDLTSEKERERIDFKVSKLPSAFGDSSTVKIAITNLISNAIKYSSKTDKAMIRFSYRTKGDETVYFINDNGVGFDMQYSGKLFGVFQRLHNNREFEGNGVGLAIVKRIIQRNGGMVWAEGEVGKGATFYFTLAYNETKPKHFDHIITD